MMVFMADNTDEQKKRINLPSHQLPNRSLTRDEIHAASCMVPEDDGRLNRINEEFRRGFAFIKQYPRTVAFFGSARIPEDHEYYQKARRLAFRVSKELGFSVLTGGGPGIMEAANRGANEAGGDSLGLNIDLPREQVENPFVKDSVEFYYFFSRKVTLSFSSNAYLVFPGGFGTMDEFLEILTLVQTHKIPQVPLVLVGNDFWRPLDMYFKNTLVMEYGTISAEDTQLYTITDDEEKVMEILRNTPLKDTTPKPHTDE